MMQTKYLNSRLLHFLPYVIFFTGSFIFFGFFADYIGFYQEKQSLFVFSHDYFIASISQPGALTKYLGQFLTTFCYYQAAGAIVISLIICLIIYFISKIISYLSGRESIVVPLIFGTVFFILQSNYRYLLFNNLGVLLQVALFYLTIRYLKGFIPVVIFPFWYWITGGFAWIFGLSYAIFLAQKSIIKEWHRIISLFVPILLFVYFLKEYLLFLPARSLMIFPISNEETGSQFRLFIPVIALIILIPLTVKIKISFPSWIKSRISRKILFQTGLSLLLFVSSSLIFYDKVNKEYFHAERLFYLERYDDLTKYITKHPTTNRLTIFLNNIALSETGRLNDLLFHFPQSPDGQTLFLKWEMLGEVLRRGGYFYYATGMINEAHRWAYENMVMKGITPEGLKMLIRTEIINGNYTVASKYISMLKKTIFYRNEAREYERLLFDDKAVEFNPKLGPKRKSMITHDFFSITDNPYINIERVLSNDSLTLKVFEYKLAYLMLTKDFKGIAAGIEKLESFGFKKIPVHLEEAVMVCKISGSGIEVDTGNLTINPGTDVRFKQFLQTFQLYGNDLKSAEPVLRQKFGNTFWYYAFYH